VSAVFVWAALRRFPCGTAAFRASAYRLPGYLSCLGVISPDCSRLEPRARVGSLPPPARRGTRGVWVQDGKHWTQIAARSTAHMFSLRAALAVALSAFGL
jgi:hypothetical protein